jgi:hypothetical protein
MSDCGSNNVPINVIFLLLLDSGRTRQVILPNSGFELQITFWKVYQPTWNKRKYFFISPFTGDFDLPKRKCSNELFWFFFEKIRHFLSKFSTLLTSQKKSVFALK